MKKIVFALCLAVASCVGVHSSAEAQDVVGTIPMLSNNCKQLSFPQRANIRHTLSCGPYGLCTSLDRGEQITLEGVRAWPLGVIAVGLQYRFGVVTASYTYSQLNERNKTMRLDENITVRHSSGYCSVKYGGTVRYR